MATILVIDDNRAICDALAVLFRLHGLDTLSAESPEAGLAALERERVDLVVQDMNFSRDTTSGQEGTALFRDIRDRYPDLPIVLLTAWTHLEDAVRLVKAGAADYLGKPWDDEKLVTTVKNLLRLHEVSRENRRLVAARRAAREKLAGEFDLCGIVYESDAMHHVVTIAAQVAHSDVPVLITGANGVGKEMIADIIQANSPVRSGPYVKVNVGALPAELMESELFGAEAGAYTGAHKARSGRFETADGGTLFLDEIGNLSLAGQVKLLRVLQTGEFERLGSNRMRRVHARIVSATNADLGAAIARGDFREDLYYRLNVIELRVPALAERRDDILPLAQAFLGPRHRLNAEAKALLCGHDWPGNVRELQNVMRRAVLLSRDGEIGPAELSLARPAPQRPAAAPEPTQVEVEAALAGNRGVIAAAAKELGLSRQALYRRMEKFGIRRA